MKTNSTFLKVGAWAAFLSAITTATLMYGPNATVPDGFDATQELYSNLLHLYKKWVLFFHPQFAFIAALSAGYFVIKRSPALVSIALFYLATWAITEMSQQAYLIDALNQIWRPAYLAAAAEDRELWRTLITGLNGISDSQYFVVVFCFGAGSIFLGAALVQESGQARPIGAINCLIGVMSLVAFASYYAGLSAANPLVQGWYSWIYGPLQVGVRLWFAWWLFQQAKGDAEEFTGA